MENTLYTWESLGTMTGATAATVIIVQYLKGPLYKLCRVPTRLLTLVIAFVILLGAQAYGTGLTWQAVPLVMINAFLVALAAMGGYDATISIKTHDKKEM